MNSQDTTKLVIFLGIGSGAIDHVDCRFGFRINGVPERWNHTHKDCHGDTLLRDRLHQSSFVDGINHIDHLFGKPWDEDEQDRDVNHNPREDLSAKNHDDVRKFLLVNPSGLVGIGRVEQIITNFSGGWLSLKKIREDDVLWFLFQCTNDNDIENGEKKSKMSTRIRSAAVTLANRSPSGLNIVAFRFETNGTLSQKKF